MNTSVALAVLALAISAHRPLTAEAVSVQLSQFNGNGGRVSWSADGRFVVVDRKGPDGGFDLYLSDFESARCLTCDHPDLPNPKRNYGQPAIHPDGRYLVFQAEKQKHGFVVPLATNPGAGVFNDIWLYDLETDKAAALREVPNDKQHGVLHPHFSKNGTQLSWSEMYEGTDLKIPGKHAGAWLLKVADFSPEGLSNVREYKPGEDVIYENHGFSHDGKWLFFSSNMKRSLPVNENTDIYKIHLETRELIRLTDEGYNEHAHLSPDGRYIVWMSSVGNGDSYDYYTVGSDYWLMNADGTGKRRLTHLNDPSHPHFRGRYAVVADFAWDSSSSEESGYRFLAYLHELVFKNFKIRTTDSKAKGEYNFMVEFTIDATATDKKPSSAEVSQSNPMIHAQGTGIVDGNGEPVHLRGVLLEGWLMWNGPLWGAGLSSETKLAERIESLVGR